MSRWSFHMSRRRVATLAHSFGLAVAVSGSLGGCSKAGHKVDRKPVYPVHGKLLVNDAPAPGALVVLHPLNEQALSERPRGSVADDGSFELTTYDGKDGAPAGEYSVTVEWRVPVDQGNGPVPGPNQLPQQYARPATSDLRATVTEGANELQPIAIRR
ncbi:MAG TPA: hypothetical protein VGX76_09540 [Pirellulales bacterium]|nr:hypothetical protein [Pirellulales bacterium]